MIWDFTYQRLFLAFFKAASNVVSSTGYSLSCLKGLRFAKATRKLYYSSRINPNKVSPSGFLIIRWGVFFFLFFFEIRLYFQVFFQIRKKDSPNKRNPPIFSGFLPSRKNNHGYGILKSKKKTGREKLPIWNPPIFSGFLPSFFSFPFVVFFLFFHSVEKWAKQFPKWNPPIFSGFLPNRHLKENPPIFSGFLSLCLFHAPSPFCSHKTMVITGVNPFLRLFECGSRFSRGWQTVWIVPALRTYDLNTISASKQQHGKQPAPRFFFFWVVTWVQSILFTEQRYTSSVRAIKTVTIFQPWICFNAAFWKTTNLTPALMECLGHVKELKKRYQRETPRKKNPPNQRQSTFLFQGLCHIPFSRFVSSFWFFLGFFFVLLGFFSFFSLSRFFFVFRAHRSLSCRLMP